MIAGTIFLGVSGLIAASGKHYIIPEGTLLKAYVDDDVELPSAELGYCRIDRSSSSFLKMGLCPCRSAIEHSI